ncbi:hypothetical protein DRJ71_19005, partial [Enterococcus faecalis]
MKLWKKVVLGFLSVLLVVVAGVCAYGIKMYSLKESIFNMIGPYFDGGMAAIDLFLPELVTSEQSDLIWDRLTEQLDLQFYSDGI